MRGAFRREACGDGREVHRAVEAEDEFGAFGEGLLAVLAEPEDGAYAGSDACADGGPGPPPMTAPAMAAAPVVAPSVVTWPAVWLLPRMVPSALTRGCGRRRGR